MELEQVDQFLFALRRGVVGKVDSCIRKGLIGWCKDGELPLGLQRLHEFRLTKSGQKGSVAACALRCPHDVIGCVVRQKHLVHDVDDAVAGGHVGRGHRGAVDHDRFIADRERQNVAAQRGFLGAVRNVGSGELSHNNVVTQDFSEVGLSFRRVVVGEVNPRIGESLVGWGEDGERTIALQGLKKFGLNHGCYERTVCAGASCCCWDVVWRGDRVKHLVNDVDDAVARHGVRSRDRCSVHRNGFADVEGQREAVGGRKRVTVGDVGGRNRARHDVSQQDFFEGRHAGWRIEGGQVNALVSEGLVGWCEHRKGSLRLQR